MPEETEAFLRLSEEKKLHIINSALEVFATHEYKHASTDDIAAKAGISKGLLFYYFHNKKELYLYLYHYCEKVITELVVDTGFYSCTDFFELMQYCAEKKAVLMEKMPFLTDFCLRAFYSEKEDVTNDMHQIFIDASAEMFQTYMSRLDYSKFKDGLDPNLFFKMLFWMADGFINEKRRSHHPFSANELLQEFNSWLDMLKYIAYKEEYYFKDVKGFPNLPSLPKK